MKTSVIALLPLASWVSATGDWSEEDCPEESSSSYAPTASLTYVPRPAPTGPPEVPVPTSTGLTSTIYTTQYNTKGVVVETIVVPVSTTVCPYDTTSSSTSTSTPVSTPVPSSQASFPVQPVASGGSLNPYPPPGATSTTKSYGTITTPTATPSATSPVTAGAVPNVHSSGGFLAAMAGLIAAFL